MIAIRLGRVSRRLAILASICAAVLLASAGRADAGLTIAPDGFAMESRVLDQAVPENQAGARADQVTRLAFSRAGDEGDHVSGSPRNTEFRLPPGLVGDPGAVPTCARALFNAMVAGSGECPAASQIGLGVITPNFGNGLGNMPVNTAVYNVVPQEGVLAELGLVVVTVPVHVLIRVDPVTRGVIAELKDTSQGAAIEKSLVTLWGVPGDESHDVNQRGCGTPYLMSYCPVKIPRKPFLTNPARCGELQVAHVATDSWEEPGVIQRAVFTSPDPLMGCDRLTFSPSLDARATAGSAEAPAGLAVHLNLPQSEDPDSFGTPPLRTARVTLPEGMSINPASAAGLGACTDAQLGLGTDNPNLCPDNAKLGTVTAVSPALEKPVQGSVYLRTQNSNDPESGEMFRAAMVLEQPERGLLIKQAGQIKVNKSTGRIETIFADNPQLPVSSIDLNLKSGPRAALQTPKACGTYATDYELTSWGGQVVKGQSKFTIDQNCSNGGFKPGFEAGTVNPLAGKSSPFTMRVTRDDGEQNISRIEATLPEGLLAKLAGVAVCGDAQAASGNCPAASKIGSTTVGAGAGSNPLYVPQPGKPATAAYLAGPYKGAPLSVVVEVPAQAGPFDLGTVVVRNALHIDPTTSQARVSSDPLPQVIQGIPISYRDIRVDVDRSNFTLNPTSCDPMKVGGTIGSAQGKSANVSSRFQVANCAELPFKPKLALALSGAPNRRGGFPALKATLTMPKGGANIARAQVTLPKTEILEQGHIRTICTRVQYAADNCPKASIYGYARAWSPLLDKPLQGPVYLRSSSNPLPDLVASLDGQIHIDLAGRIDSVNARIRNTFELVPDAPVSKFVLTMQGGRKSLLVNNTDLCKAKPRATASFDGQNGKVSDSNPLVKVAGCKGKSRK